MDSKLRYVMQVVYNDGAVLLIVTTERINTALSKVRDRVIQNMKLPGWEATSILQKYVVDHIDEVGEGELLGEFSDTCSANIFFNELFDLAIDEGINLLNTNKKNVVVTNPLYRE